MRRINKKKLIRLVAIIIILIIIIFIIAKACGGKKKDSDSQPQTDESGNIIGVDTPEARDEAIGSLIKRYRAACINIDENVLKDVYNSDSVMDIEVIKEMNKYITGYTDTQCYIKEGANEKSFVVFVKDYINLKNISTPVPSLATYYVMRDEFGKYYIYPGEFSNTSGSYYFDTDISTAISKAQSDPEIVDIVSKVNTEYVEACNKDEKLKKFSENIALTINEGSSSSKPSQPETPEDTQGATDEPEEQ